MDDAIVLSIVAFSALGGVALGVGLTLVAQHMGQKWSYLNYIKGDPGYHPQEQEPVTEEKEELVPWHQTPQ